MPVSNGPKILRCILLAAAAASLSGCVGSKSDVISSASVSAPSTASYINDKTKFSVSAYGVAASPRITTSRAVRRGGGRRQVGKPYKIRGRWYEPKEEPGYDRKGQASWYGPNFHGRLTANGEIYDQFALSGAHPTFPLPSYARVTNQANGHSVIVRVNDRGPYHDGRIIDLSAQAAGLLDYRHKGIANVRVEYVGPAPLDGNDRQYLQASVRGVPASSQAVQVASADNTADAGEQFDRTVTGSVSSDASTATKPTSGAKLGRDRATTRGGR